MGLYARFLSLVIGRIPLVLLYLIAPLLIDNKNNIEGLPRHDKNNSK